MAVRHSFTHSTAPAEQQPEAGGRTLTGGRPLIVAHRSLSPGQAENAISALHPAVAVGADLIELDIRLSLDRTPMVLHDAMLGRTTTGHGWVRLWPAVALRRLALRNVPAIESPPSLATLLRSMPPGAQAALHLKDTGAIGPVLRLIEHLGTANQTWLWLERPGDVYTATRRLPNLRVTLLRPGGWQPNQRASYFREAQWVGASGVSLPSNVIDNDLVTAAHQHQLRVFTRLDVPARARQLIPHGVDGFITTDPGAVRQMVAPGFVEDAGRD